MFWREMAKEDFESLHGWKDMQSLRVCGKASMASYNTEGQFRSTTGFWSGYQEDGFKIKPLLRRF